MVNSYFWTRHWLHRLCPVLSLAGRCLLCGAASHSNIDICNPCRADLPWLEPGCSRCAVPLPDPDDHALCGQCLTQPPAFQRTEAGWRYQPPLAQLIAAYKYQHKLSYGRSLSLLMAGQLVTAYTGSAFPDLVTAVPLHWWRHLHRGFNQSEMIARLLAGTLQLPYLPLLQRTRPTTAQQTLDAEQRRRNLRHAFRCLTPLHGERIALVDDVMTTGATANELSQTLLKAGAGEVHIWCLARTPP